MSDDETVVSVHKAQSIEGRQPVPSMSISIGGLGEFPRLSDLDRADAAQDADARSIVTVLRESLPGGTFDRVAGLLVLATASRLVIPIPDAPYLASVSSAARRGLGRAQRLLARSAVDGDLRERAEARAAVAWLEDQICGARVSGSLISAVMDDDEDERASPASSVPESAVVESSVPIAGFMTWRDLVDRLGALDLLGSGAADQEVVVRIEDDDGSSHCGGLQSVDVEAGCTEEPALVIDASSVSICEDVIPFADGALGATRASVFRRHLGSCTSCMVNLAEALQLSAQIGDSSSPRRSRLAAAGVAAEHCAVLDALVRDGRYSDDPNLAICAVAVRAALSALAGGPLLSASCAEVLVSLRRRWMAETTDISPFLGSLCVLMEALGLDVGDWTGRHIPAVADSGLSPGVKIVGCSCGWRVPSSAQSPTEAFDLHHGEARSDEMIDAHTSCNACESSSHEDAAILMLRIVRAFKREVSLVTKWDIDALIDGSTPGPSGELVPLLRASISHTERSSLDAVRARLANILAGSGVEESSHDHDGR
jgi:hypothetical protein